jgi:hypothetical protein
MKTYKKLILTLASVFAIFATVVTLTPSTKVNANPGVFNVMPPLFTKATTTAPWYSHLKAGFSTTTTQALDSYISGTNGVLDQGSASLLLTLTSTSTPATLKWRYEFSQDGIDWYPESVELSTNATTTVVVRDFKEYSWLFASSTAGSASTTLGTSQKLVSVPTPTRFVRTVFYLASGSPNAALHYRYVSKSQK